MEESLRSLLYQLSLIEYHMDCSRTPPSYQWPVPPEHPKVYIEWHNTEAKIREKIERCLASITLKMADEKATATEYDLVVSHPVWKSLITFYPNRPLMPGT